MRFRTKILLSTVLVLALSFGVGGTLLLSLSFSSLLGEEEDAAVQSYRMVQSTLSLVNAVSDQTGPEDVADILSQLAGQQPGGGITLRVREGAGETVYLGDSRFSDLLLDLWADTQEEQGVMQLFSAGESRYYQITSQFRMGETVCYLDGLYDMSSVYALRESQQQIYFRVFWVVVALGGALSWLIATLLTRPLTRLSRTAQSLAQGDLSRRSRIRGGDEVAALSKEFDRMADSIQDYVNQLQETMRRQEEFMGSFAHELKTPMTSIIGYADLLRSQSLPPEDARQAANYIFREGSRLEHLSLKLLDLLVLGKDDFALTRTDLPQLARQVRNTMEPVAEKNGVRLRVYCQPGSALLEPELAKSLILNLLDNGRKALDGDGEKTLLLGIQPTGDDGCEIQVMDNGRGIPPEEIERLTEAFYRVDKSRSRAQGGAGLGLALCREIVRIHHGTMTFQSELGKGTLFTVDLRGGDASREENGRL